MSKLSELTNWLNSAGVSDLGENAMVLLDLVKTKKDSRFMDVGVRGGVSSAILSYESEENNNQVCGCDLNFGLFYNGGRRFVNENYTCSIDACYITCILKRMRVSIIKPNGIYNIPCFPTEERQNIIDYINELGYDKLQKVNDSFAK